MFHWINTILRSHIYTSFTKLKDKIIFVNLKKSLIPSRSHFFYFLSGVNLKPVTATYTELSLQFCILLALTFDKDLWMVPWMASHPASNSKQTPCQRIPTDSRWSRLQNPEHTSFRSAWCNEWNLHPGKKKTKNSTRVRDKTELNAIPLTIPQSFISLPSVFFLWTID